MKKRVMYRTEVSVDNMILEAEKGIKICSKEVKEVLLIGYIFHCSERKLFGMIPLPNKYTYKIYSCMYVRNKYTGRVYTAKPSVLSFESKKRLMEEKQKLESWLRNKCN